MNTLMQLEGVRLVVGRDGKIEVRRRRFWGLWWQRVKRLPLDCGGGIILTEAGARQTPGGGWDASMVWWENGDANFTGEVSLPAPPEDARAILDKELG